MLLWKHFGQIGKLVFLCRRGTAANGKIHFQHYHKSEVCQFSVGLKLVGCHNLRDLFGLEGITAWPAFSVSLPCSWSGESRITERLAIQCLALIEQRRWTCGCSDTVLGQRQTGKAVTPLM